MARLFGLVLVVAAAVYLTAIAVATAAAYGLYRLARWSWSTYRAHSAAAEHQRSELLARAEIQHRWYLAGDPRGTYGRYPPAECAFDTHPSAGLHDLKSRGPGRVGLRGAYHTPGRLNHDHRAAAPRPA